MLISLSILIHTQFSVCRKHDGSTIWVTAKFRYSLVIERIFYFRVQLRHHPGRRIIHGYLLSNSFTSPTIGTKLLLDSLS